MKLGELAMVETKPPNTYIIDLITCPDEKKGILEALAKANLNLNPQVHQNVITMKTPMITREHRENVAKSIRLKCSQTIERMKKVETKAVRKAQDAKNVSEDLIFRTGQYVKILVFIFI